MRFAAAALAFQAIAAALGPILLWRGPVAIGLATAYVLVGLLGGIVLYVIGFFYKIVPLLAWTARFGGKAERARGADRRRPFLGARRARAARRQWSLAIVVLAAAILIGVVAAAYAGAALFLIGVLLFVSQIGRVAFGGGPSNAGGTHDRCATSRRRPVTGKDRVSDVLARDESLVDVFVRQAPHFAKLRNRAMRRVMARLVTVEQAARTANVSTERLVGELNEALGISADPRR